MNNKQSAKVGEASPGNGNINYERMQYYYHSDHLGSSSYITNLDGAVVQHVEYVPFGEVFIEERNNTWNTPYLFNGKELDEETGLYYYGARYFNPRESVWLSVDPLSGYNPIFETEHYIDGQHNGGVYNSFNHNTYGYCYQNPVLLTDPNGKQSVSKQVVGQISASFAESLKNTAPTPSKPKTIGTLYGVAKTLIVLGDATQRTRTKFANTKPGTSIASEYFRNTSWGNKETPKFIFDNVPKRIYDPITGETSPFRSNRLGALAGRSVPVAARVVIGAGIAQSGYNIYTAENQGEQIAREGVIWTGAITGGEIGATYGSFIGPWGTFGGGVIGGIVGGTLGESVFDRRSCNGCVKSDNNYLEEGMKMDGGLKSYQDRSNEKKATSSL